MASGREWTNLFVAPNTDFADKYVVPDTGTRPQRFYRLHAIPASRMEFTFALILLLAIHAAPACDFAPFQLEQRAGGISVAVVQRGRKSSYRAARTMAESRPATSYVDSSMTLGPGL
jgi:hypothetical protein